MTKLMIFDLDGTLLNTLENLAVATNLALARHGFPEHPVEDYRYFVGNGLRMQITRALPESARDPETVEKLMEEELEYYTAHQTDCTAPFPGVLEALLNLQAKGVLLAVVTNKPDGPAQELARVMFPGVTFCAVRGNRPGEPLKPDPAAVDGIIAQTGVTPSETRYFGDSGVDMETARNAGIMGVGVLWGYRPREELERAGAAAVIERPDEILRFLHN